MEIQDRQAPQALLALPVIRVPLEMQVLTAVQALMVFQEIQDPRDQLGPLEFKELLVQQGNKGTLEFQDQ